MKVKAKTAKPASKPDDDEKEFEIDDGEIAAHVQSTLNQSAQNWLKTPDGFAKVLGENYKYRTKIKELTQRVKDLEADAIPEGHAMITPDEVKEYEAYKALGKPDDLKTQQDELKTLRTKSQDLDLQGIARDAGLSYEVFAKLSRLDNLSPASFDSREIEIQNDAGEKIKAKQFYIVTKDASGKVTGETKLTDYIDKNWKDFKPSLLLRSNQSSTNMDTEDGSDEDTESGHQVLPFPAVPRNSGKSDSYDSAGEKIFASSFSRLGKKKE